jgi:hypothetical protein
MGIRRFPQVIPEEIIAAYLYTPVAMQGVRNILITREIRLVVCDTQSTQPIDFKRHRRNQPTPTQRKIALE